MAMMMVMVMVMVMVMLMVMVMVMFNSPNIVISCLKHFFVQKFPFFKG